jgi:hypothetical protein
MFFYYLSFFEGTIPVHKMGQFALYDAFLSRVMSEDFHVFTLDDVDEVFENAIEVRSL